MLSLFFFLKKTLAQKIYRILGERLLISSLPGKALRLGGGGGGARG